MMNNRVKRMYKFVKRQCNRPDVGYSQKYRGMYRVNGITHFDCSSLIWYALKEAGFDLSGYSYPFTTYTMDSVLRKLGFVRLDAATTKWKKGDILWRQTHTEMVYKGQITMGAHSSSYPLEKQVSINDYVSDKSSWGYIYRFK